MLANKHMHAYTNTHTQGHRCSPFLSPLPSNTFAWTCFLSYYLNVPYCNTNSKVNPEPQNTLSLSVDLHIFPKRQSVPKTAVFIKKTKTNPQVSIAKHEQEHTNHTLSLVKIKIDPAPSLLWHTYVYTSRGQHCYSFVIWRLYSLLKVPVWVSLTYFTQSSSSYSPHLDPPPAPHLPSQPPPMNYIFQ